MRYININHEINVTFLLYPDNQPHVTVNAFEGEDVEVVCSMLNSIDVLHLLQVSNALDNLFCKKVILRIPYLMGARFDRLMNLGDSIDLKVISDLINSCGFAKVYLYDVHSDTATMLIKNSVNNSNYHLVTEYTTQDSILICPDAGASKKIIKYFEWNKNIVDVVHCIKSRDLSNGNLTLKVLEPEKCTDKNCVIIDDLCDGGGTFVGIGSQITPKRLALIVTHGIFSKGFELLERYFDKIIVSNSRYQVYDSKIVKVIPII